MNISPKIAGWNNIYGVEFEGSSCVSRGSSAALTLSSSNVEGVYYKLNAALSLTIMWVCIPVQILCSCQNAVLILWNTRHCPIRQDLLPIAIM